MPVEEEAVQVERQEVLGRRARSEAEMIVNAAGEVHFSIKAGPWPPNMPLADRVDHRDREALMQALSEAAGAAPGIETGISVALEIPGEEGPFPGFALLQRAEEDGPDRSPLVHARLYRARLRDRDGPGARYLRELGMEREINAGLTRLIEILLNQPWIRTFIYDGEGTILYANFGAAMLFTGNDVTDITGMNILEFSPPLDTLPQEEAQELRRRRKLFLQGTGTLDVTEVTGLDMQGTAHRVRTLVTPVTLPNLVLARITGRQEFADDPLGETRVAVNVFLDLDQEQRLREALAFAAVLRHDLATPLTAILGFLQVLDPSHREFKNDISRITQAAERLRQILDTHDLLSKAAAGRQLPPPERHPLNQILQSAIDTFAGEARSLGLELTFAIPEEDITAFIYPNPLLEALENLIQNAIKFTPRGGKINVTLTLSEDGRNAIIQVEDTGKGIHQDDLPHIFDLFRQGRINPIAADRGSGIGLHVVRRVTELHRGSVKAESKLDQGTRFTLSIPLTRNP